MPGGAVSRQCCEQCPSAGAPNGVTRATWGCCLLGLTLPGGADTHSVANPTRPIGPVTVPGLLTSYRVCHRGSRGVLCRCERFGWGELHPPGRPALHDAEPLEPAEGLFSICQAAWQAGLSWTSSPHSMRGPGPQGCCWGPVTTESETPLLCRHSTTIHMACAGE